MARILLLAANPKEKRDVFIPYALLFLKSALEKNRHEVVLVDFQNGSDADKAFKAEIMKKPDVLGISLFCGPGVAVAKNASRLCRKLSPNTCIVWGGILPTLSPEMAFEESSLDYVIQYEGEESFVLFVDALVQGKDLRTVPNLVYRNGERVVLPPPPERFLDLENFPPLDFTDTIGSRYIFKHLFFGKRVVPIYTSRGCPYNCTFCYNLFYNRCKWRPFPTSWVLDTIDNLVQTYQIDGLLALDDNFCADRERVRAIFEGVRARGHALNWWVELRIDQVLEMSLKELKELRALGLRIAYLGVESGCNRILRLFNKGVTVDQIHEANRKLAQIDIAACYTFIIGAPTETSSETLETVDLAVKLLEENPLASVWQFNQYTPYPGTSLYKYAIKNGFQPFRSLNDWDVGWTVRDQNLSSTSLSQSNMATLRYAALFQTPDLHLTNRSFIYKVFYKSFREIFAFRLRRHLLTPFLDTWAIGLLFGIARLLNRWRIYRLSSRMLS